MIVVDASALVVALTGADERSSAAERALSGDGLVAPNVIRAEFVSAIRGVELAGHLDAGAASQALDWCRDLPLDLHPVEPHLQRMWELRHNVTPYDAWYVALAEALEVPLLTTDARLARATGPRCDFEVV